LNNLQKFTASWRILPFTEPGTEPPAITADAMKRSSVLLVEIKYAAEAADLATGAGDLDTGKPSR
jgi:hypothetical protein